MKRVMHNLWLLSIVMIALIGFIKSVSAQSVIPISGLAANHEGIAAWNADGTGPESAKIAHIIPGSGGIRAFYYTASLDYDKIDTSSNAALCRGMEPVTGFPRFTAALQANGFSISQLKAKVGLQSLGNDIQGQDWMMDGFVETRYYRGGTFIFELNGEKMVGGSTPRSTVAIDYSTFPFRISSATDFVIPADSSRRSSPAVQAVAAAFLAEVGNLGIRIVNPALIIFHPITEKGRSGIFLEFQSGRLELGTTPVSVKEASPNYPAKFELMQSYPNPFNPETEIRFQLPKASHVVVKIFNTIGEEIRTLLDAEYQAGSHQSRWDGKDKHGHPVASGVYLYQLKAGNFSQVQKMTLQR